VCDVFVSLCLRAGIACYERALALMPRHADALYNLGVACAEDGQTERALFCYELTTHFNPNCAEAWNNLGVLHKEADNLERAAECYMSALNIRPSFPQVCAFPLYTQSAPLGSTKSYRKVQGSPGN
jgi:tetratricopeptide (TPR) repeat protein